jgi:hypothetical protein
VSSLADRNGGKPGGPTDCRGEPLDLEPMFAAPAGADARDRDAERVRDFDDAAERYAALRTDLGIALLEGPATSADLLELDAVPDPVDSDAQRNRRSERP